MVMQESHVPLSMSVQQKFIAFSGYLHHKGLATLVADVCKAVEIELKGYALINFGIIILHVSNTEVASSR